MKFVRIKELADCSAVVLRPVGTEEDDRWAVAHDAPNGVEGRRSPGLSYEEATARYESEIGLPGLDATGLRFEVFALVTRERLRQEAKFGRQAHDDVDRTLTDRPGGCTPERMAEEYEIPAEVRSKFNCNMGADRSKLAWAAIAVEELCEAVAAATDAQQGRGPQEAVEQELVQTAAVLFAWLEDKIGRRRQEAAARARFHDAVAEVARVFGAPTWVRYESREAWWASDAGEHGPDGLRFSVGAAGPRFVMRAGIASDERPLQGLPLARAAREARGWFARWDVSFPTKGVGR